MFQTSGSKLLQRLSELLELERAGAAPGAASAPPPLFELPDMSIASMAYTGSDSFWADISGVLGLDGVPSVGVGVGIPGGVPVGVGAGLPMMHPAQQDVWPPGPPGPPGPPPPPPRDMEHWGAPRPQ